LFFFITLAFALIEVRLVMPSPLPPFFFLIHQLIFFIQFLAYFLVLFLLLILYFLLKGFALLVLFLLSPPQAPSSFFKQG